MKKDILSTLKFRATFQFSRTFKTSIDQLGSTFPNWIARKNTEIDEERDAYEIVSPMLEGKAGLDTVESFITWAQEKRFKHNASCSFIVEHDFFTSKNEAIKCKSLYNLIGIWTSIEKPVTNTLVKKHVRVNPSYVTYNSCLPDVILSMQKLRKEKLDITLPIFNKFLDLNLNPFLTEGTVEFRMHQMSLDPNVTYNLIDWIVLTHLITDKVKKPFNNWMQFEPLTRCDLRSHLKSKTRTTCEHVTTMYKHIREVTNMSPLLNVELSSKVVESQIA